MTEQDQQEIKNHLILLSIYEYLFGSLSSFQKFKCEFPQAQPAKIPLPSFDHISDDRELLKKAITRFSDVGIKIRLEGDQCIIG